MGTITKALELLNHFSRAQPALGLGDFVRLTGRDKATVHRHLVELERNGLLEQDPHSRAYRLGPALLRLSGVREATFPMRSAVRPIVQALSRTVGELAHVSLVQGDLLSPLVHADPLAHGVQVHFDEAELLPLHATASGLAVLAFAKPAFTDAVLAGPLPALTGQTPTDPARLRALLAEVRDTGIALLDRGFDAEVTSQGAPVFGASGQVIGALSIAIPAMRATADRMQAIRPALCDAAVRVTHAVGGHLPEAHAAKWRTAARPQPDPGGTP